MRGSQIRINLIDVGTNEIFKLLAQTLKAHAKIPSVSLPSPASNISQSLSAGCGKKLQDISQNSQYLLLR